MISRTHFVTRCSTRCLTALAAAALTSISSAEPAVSRVEVSADGRQRVTLDAAPQTPAPATPAAGQALPYGAQPDWANDLRRQVGGLQVADMNGDGLADVVVGCYISNSFPPYDDWHNMIYYNVGGALEASPSWISTNEVSTGDVQVGDIDGDGFLDIFAANGGGLSNPSVVYFGAAGGPSTSPGWFSAEPGGAWNNYAILFDFDHDGDVDVVTANQGASEFDPYRPMFAFRNDKGTLQNAPFWQSAEVSIQNFLAFGDLDGDGWEDLAVSKWVNWESGVYMNVGGTLATTPGWTTGNDDDDKGIAWSDVDDDGDEDLALGHDPTALYRNDTGVLTSTWSATAPYFGPSDLRFADVDGDGDEDLAEVHFANGHVNIYLNDAGTLASSPSWNWDSSAVGTAIAFGDISGNGLPDLVVGNSGDDSVLVFYNQLMLCPIDLDGSGDVGFTDLSALLQAWGPCVGDCPADFDGSGDVGFADLSMLLGAWGRCV